MPPILPTPPLHRSDTDIGALQAGMRYVSLADYYGVNGLKKYVAGRE